MHNGQRFVAAMAVALLAVGCLSEPKPEQQDDDSGVVTDSGDGRSDAGRDAGERDAGDHDAGEGDGAVVDAGEDAAVDAGSDASCADSPSTGEWCDDGTFGTCESQADCAGNTLCSDDGHCVLCRNDNDCPSRVCGPRHTCEGCRDNTQCPFSAGAHCNVNEGRCEGCVSDGECSAWGVCDERGGHCGECVVGEDDVCLNGLACVDQWGGGGVGTCTGKKRKTRTACQLCVVDSECADGYGCVDHLFKGKTVSSYCTQKKPSGGTCPAGTPATVSGNLDARASRWKLGANGAQEFCVPDAMFASCSGLNSFGTSCTAEQETAGTCGDRIVEGASSGLCVGPAGAQVCSFTCKTNADCAAGTCVGVSPRYCDPF